MRSGHPNCSDHPRDVFENGVTNAGSWKPQKGSMIVSHEVLYTYVYS